MYMRFLCFLLMGVWLSALSAFADVRFQQEYFEDKTSSLTIEQILAQGDALEWKPISGHGSRFGYSSSRIWVRFRIHESEFKVEPRENLLFEVPYMYLERIVFHAVRAGKVESRAAAGWSVPVSQRDSRVLKSGSTVFRVLDPWDPAMAYYVSIEGKYPLALPVKLQRVSRFTIKYIEKTLYLGGFLGLMALAALFNGFLAISLRSALYLQYSLFVVAIGALYLANEGLTIQFFWPESPWWAVREMHIYGALALLFYVQFVRLFLNSRENTPRLDRALLFLVVVSCVRAVWVLFDPSMLMAALGEAAVISSNVLVLVIGLTCLMRGYKAARYFFASSLVFNLAMVLFMLQETNIIYFGEFVFYAPYVGTAIEVSLLSLALADRIRHTNVELARQKTAVVHADKMSMLGRMAGEIAHEINNPLAIIHGNASLLSSLEELPPQAREFARTIEQTANRISKTVRGMRTLARDTRKDPFQHTSFASILQDTLVLCQDRICNGKVKFYTPEPDPSLSLRCRGSEISQVLVNLLNNAVDAAEGRADSWVRLEIEPRNGMLEVSVSDNGCGVPKAYRGRVHEPFFTTKEVGKGLGLGLSIARTIVEGHGGTLKLDESSEHTRFVFSVPLS
jgi:signal transduction histidine kinase